jgi:hypothetical protein
MPSEIATVYAVGMRTFGEQQGAADFGQEASRRMNAEPGIALGARRCAYMPAERKQVLQSRDRDDHRPTERGCMRFGEQRERHVVVTQTCFLASASVRPAALDDDRDSTSAVVRDDTWHARSSPRGRSLCLCVDATLRAVGRRGDARGRGRAVLATRISRSQLAAAR